MSTLINTLANFQRLLAVPEALPIADRDWPQYVVEILLQTFPYLKDIEFYYVMDECYDEIRCFEFTTMCGLQKTLGSIEYQALLDILTLGVLDPFEQKYAQSSENFGSYSIVKFKLGFNCDTVAHHSIERAANMTFINSRYYTRDYQTDRQLIDILARYNLQFVNQFDNAKVTICVNVSPYLVHWTDSREQIPLIVEHIDNNYPSLKDFVYVTCNSDSQYDAYNDSTDHCLNLDLIQILPDLLPFNYANEIIKLAEEND